MLVLPLFRDQKWLQEFSKTKKGGGEGLLKMDREQEMP